MNNFIVLNSVIKKKYINPLEIVYMDEYESNSKNFTMVYLASNYQISVIETPEQIDEIIDNWLNISR